MQANKMHKHNGPGVSRLNLALLSAISLIFAAGAAALADSPASPPANIAALQPAAPLSPDDAIAGANPASDSQVALLDSATTEEENQIPDADKLGVTFELPLWFSGMNGNVGVRGLTIPFNASFTQILGTADSVIGIGGRLEADYRNWIVYGDGLYMELDKNDIPVGPAKFDALASLAVANLGLLYQFKTWEFSEREDGEASEGDRRISLAGGVAARYMHVGLGITAANGLSRTESEDWYSPLGAGQVKFDLDRHWQILSRGDVGAGGGAELTWSVALYLTYQFQFSSRVSGFTRVGYEALSEDYHNGKGFQEFTWDVIMHGPVVVLGVQF
jgi:hypothetical protein